MAFIGPLLGAGTSLIGAIMNANAQKQATEVSRQSLNETKRQNRASEELARSTRSDAYGNKLVYTPGIGWTYDLAPMTASILSAEQKEQRANLLEDAPRTRAANIRMDERAKLGDEEFQKKFNEYRFRPPRSEASDITDATNSLLSARRKGLDESSSMLARQLIRTGMGSNLQGLFKTTNDQYADSLADAILKGKQVGSDNYTRRRAADEQFDQGELGFLSGMAGQTRNVPGQMTGTSGDLSSRADAAQNALMQAIQSSRGASQNAYSQLSNTTGQGGLDLSGVASALSRLNFEDDDDEQQRYPMPPNDPATGQFNADAWLRKHPGLF